MLRFIIKRETYDAYANSHRATHYTLDEDVPTVERELTRGGYGEHGSDVFSLIGVEILHGRWSERRHEMPEDKEAGNAD